MTSRRAAIVALTGAAVGACAAHAQGGDGPPMTPVQVSPRCWFVQGVSALGSPANGNFVSNAGFVVTDTSVVVIDALGAPALAARLLQHIRRIAGGKPVSHVLVTHYHADHIYGLQAFKDAGATIVAHGASRDYLHSETARQRLEVSRTDLAPWIDASTRLVGADRWIDRETELVVGGVRFMLRPVGPSHTPEDIVVEVPADGVLYAGDLVFAGRIPFVGQADSRRWIASIDALIALAPKVIVPGHGRHSVDALADLRGTREYLVYLRRTMGEAARNMEPFEEAYARTDWSRFEAMPLFGPANRMNAYNTYLLMEHEK